MQTLTVAMTITVEPETDMKHYQPGLYCATLDGTDWRWVDDTPESAVRHLLDWMLRGGYRDHDWPKEQPYKILAQ